MLDNLGDQALAHVVHGLGMLGILVQDLLVVFFGRIERAQALVQLANVDVRVVQNFRRRQRDQLLVALDGRLDFVRGVQQVRLLLQYIQLF